MRRVIIDTNVLIAISDFKIDIFSALREALDFRFDTFVLEGSIKELEKIISEQRGRYRDSAKLALQIVRKMASEDKIYIAKDYDPKVLVDDNLVYESKEGALVLTQDVELKKRLSRPYLTIRQKKYVILVE